MTPAAAYQGIHEARSSHRGRETGPGSAIPVPSSDGDSGEETGGADSAARATPGPRSGACAASGRAAGSVRVMTHSDVFAPVSGLDRPGTTNCWHDVLSSWQAPGPVRPPTGMSPSPGWTGRVLSAAGTTFSLPQAPGPERSAAGMSPSPGWTGRGLSVAGTMFSLPQAPGPGRSPTGTSPSSGTAAPGPPGSGTGPAANPG